MKISVVIPIYNAEKYLNRCLKSLINQTYSNLEIILVDDGSSDECPKLCEIWKKKDNRIKVLHKENEGVGYARNSGINASSGEYISFIDADDYVDLNMFQELVDAVKSFYLPDVIYFSYQYQKADGCLIRGDADFPKELSEDELNTFMKTICFGKSMRKPDGFELGSAGAGIYRLNYLKDFHLQFRSEREFLSEDYVFMVDLCKHNPKVIFLPKAFYFYCENLSSLTHTYRPDRFEKAEQLYLWFKCIIEKEKYSKDALTRAKDGFLINTMIAIRQIVQQSDINQSEEIEAICNSKILQEMLSDYPKQELNIKRRIYMEALIRKNVFILKLLTVIRERRK